ncbi:MULTISPECIES: restriction endonuclease subunit S [unclassified Arthrobacter]|uniref:restriction endonuclease subunit S n=1 Tax=unclassified Arthrobacter TaxID=235627 RepID=UPI002E01F76B|nr:MULTISPECIES: restriction endonuclease subunit S [unclassified Arthrobacter]MEC5192697.1 type I restriction enzyme S subunit [Arthrobacter sp. MP_M4]MEC5204180.1 type I restriction enzyme S subunit [Arthrobacter sp. MP_M7]
MTWPSLVLGDSLEFLIDNRGKNPEFSEHGIPAISGMSVGNGVLDLSAARRVSPDVWNKWMPHKTRRHDVVLTSEAPLGRVALVESDEPLTLAQRVFGLRGRAGVLDSRFLFYSFQTTQVQSDLQGRATGTTVLGIRQPALLKVQIPAPRYDEQRAIAEVLGALDDKIAANTKLAATAGGLAGLMYDRSAAGLETRPMSEVLSPVLGGTPPRSRPDFWTGDQLWASAKDITGAEFGVVRSTDEKITYAAITGTKAKPLPAGSVILTARGTVGAVARLAAPASFNQSCYGFVPGEIPSGVLYFAITRAMLRAKEIAHGSVFDTITMKTFDHLEFPAFDCEALKSTEARVAPLLEKITAVVVENSCLSGLRDALLPQLMSGKLRVKNAENVLVNAGV